VLGSSRSAFSYHTAFTSPDAAKPAPYRKAGIDCVLVEVADKSRDETLEVLDAKREADPRVSTGRRPLKRPHLWLILNVVRKLFHVKQLLPVCSVLTITRQAPRSISPRDDHSN
jgi:hypothetical protein